MQPISARFRDAVAYAIDLHASQARKGTPIPYISHLFGVASLAMEHGADEDAAIAGLLHDAAEDQGGEPTLREIRRRFGDRVAGIVEGCSDAVASPKPPWRERKERYIAHLADADAATCLISACDKLHNARCILADVRRDGDAAFAKFKGGKAGTLWYYRELARALRGKAPAGLTEELGRVVGEMERLSGENA
jgi:(p)ppGpp synthase/HD superfamily hydrolase